MRELLEYLARALVDEPESVSVEQFEEDDGTIVLKEDRIREWLSKGAQPTPQVRKLLKTQGIDAAAR